MQRVFCCLSFCSCLLFAACANESSPLAPLAAQAVNAAPEVAFPGAAGFVAGLSSPYLHFAAGTTFRYEGESPDGHESIVTEVTHQTKRLMGVSTTVVHDLGYVNGQLIEDTLDFYAQDSQGNVWYFGEDSKQILNGQVVGTEGSWLAGVNGARPGIAMLARPEKGDSYQQEFAAGVAEDMAKVVSLTEAVTVPYGSFTRCLETAEWSPLEPNVREHKFYASGTGLLVELGKHEIGRAHV